MRQTAAGLMTAWCPETDIFASSRGSTAIQRRDDLINSRANFWIFSNETWSTPAKHVLSGITRAKIIEALTAAGIKAEIRDIKIDEILEAEEVALSSTTKNLYPINLVQLRGKNYRFQSQNYNQNFMQELKIRVPKKLDRSKRSNWEIHAWV